MFLLSAAIRIELGKSKTYLRLVLVLYSLTVALIIYSPIYILIKGLLIGFIGILLGIDLIHMRPYPVVHMLEFVDNQWLLGMSNGRKESYLEAKLLISTILFQLIRFRNLKEEKLIVLFNDQILKDQLRLIHLKIKWICCKL